MTDLRISLIEMSKMNITKHPLRFLKDLGITYDSVESVPMGDCWIIRNGRGFIPVEFKRLFEEVING